MNDEVITQAPSLKGANILALPPEEGSWKMNTVIGVLSANLLAAGIAPKDSVYGHLFFSAYDYLVSETLGFHVDYDQSLGQQYQNLPKEQTQIPILSQHRFDSLMEKCESAIKDMHRPIFGKGTAEEAIITVNIFGEERRVNHSLDKTTYDFISQTTTSVDPEVIWGRVSSYNALTYKGRIYVPEELRPIPFELSEDARDEDSVLLISASLQATIRHTGQSDDEYIFCKVFKSTSKSGIIKRLLIVGVSNDEIE